VEPEVGLGIGPEAAGDAPPRPRPTVLMRLMEIIGLGLVVCGLGGYGFGLVAVGAVMIVASYALYRRKHGPEQPVASDYSPDGPDADGGGD
jgi:hypothetical protein